MRSSTSPGTPVSTWGSTPNGLNAIKDAMAEHKNIEIRGFGTFKVRERKSRLARNPRTGDPVEVPPRAVPVFKPSKELRAMVAGEAVSDADGDEDAALPEKAEA